MASNRFGKLFTLTTWGESHGKAIGVVIDGCPAGLEIAEEDINAALALRAPGRSAFTSPRKEGDRGEILSGVYQGKSTGAPISIIIWNQDAKPSAYAGMEDILRPGHANFTYLEKYGIVDPYGGGRASARETAGRVAAAAIAKKLLKVMAGIEVVAYLQRVGQAEVPADFEFEQKEILSSAIFCPHPETSRAIEQEIERAMQAGDSVGGVVGFKALHVPMGLGDPVYEKLEANLAAAMLSIPASKSFEIGSGHTCVTMRGSQHNDLFTLSERGIRTETNHAGGTLGGISTGMPIMGRVAFKPTSSIKLEQKSLTTEGKAVTLKFPEGSRQDPCVAIRATAVVEAMCALVLADAILLNRSAKL